MEQYIIKGGKPLSGEVEIGGAKNAALAILAAANMTNETVYIDNDGNGIFYCKGGSVSVWIKKSNLYDII